ncbi:MAG: hypothetical protein NTZ85_01070 [Bacteroidia bacterium]|nr:hypothetical protein [Bacteroidia bacterium]
MKSASLFIITVLFLVCAVPAASQRNQAERDKFTLLTMPYNKRPLALYRGQFQANAGYKFAIRARSYDKDGNVIILKDQGTASVYHYYFLNIRYGITNFLELSAETNYIKKGIRSPAEKYFSTVADVVKVNTVTETKGMGDVLLLATLRLPITYKWFDFAAKGGIFLPTAKYEPPAPKHTITNVSLTAANTYTINFHYNNTNGFGVPVYLLSAVTKFSLSKFSIEADFSYMDPVKGGKNIRWDEELVNKTFAYSSNSYKYRLNRIIEANAALHYQATGWFNIEINTNYHRSESGWTEYWGKKYKNPEEHLFTLEPAMEIQISPAITVYEITGLPLSGKNMDAPFYLFITLSYNLFPFLK